MALVPTDVQHPQGFEDRVLGIDTTTSSTIRQIDWLIQSGPPTSRRRGSRRSRWCGRIPGRHRSTNLSSPAAQHRSVARLVPSSQRRLDKVDAGAHAATRPAEKAVREDTVGCARVGGMVGSPDPEICVGAGGDVALRERRSRVDAHQARTHGEVTMTERRRHSQDQGGVLTVDDDKVLESKHDGVLSNNQ
jgi:hypothetical protein